MASRYDATSTSLPTPAGEFRIYGDLTVNLTKIDGSNLLGTYTVEGWFGTEHPLVVRDVVGTDENGTRFRRIHDTDFGGVVTFVLAVWPPNRHDRRERRQGVEVQRRRSRPAPEE